jgi:hypothetical protein
MKSLTAHVGPMIVAVRLSMLSVFRRLILSALVVALVVPNVSLFGAPVPAGQPATGTVSGAARTASGDAMPNATVRLRNLQTGQLAGTTTAGADGSFIFTALGPGNYAVELVNALGEVVGTSSIISLTAPAMVATNLIVTASAASARTAVAAVAGGSFFAGTLGVVTIAAVGAGVTGVALAMSNNGNASASR